MYCMYFFFFKQKTAYEMRISDWSSDVCSSDLDIGVVMLARQCGRQRFVDERAATRGVAVDRDRDADARTAQRDAVLGLARRDRRCESVAIIGIIDARGAVGAEIDRKSTRLNSSH